MSTLVVSRSDLYPVGTSVAAYQARGRQHEKRPAGAAIETHTVDAEGNLTFTALPERVQHQLWAEVGGEHRYLRVEAPLSASALLTTEGQTRKPIPLGLR